MPIWKASVARGYISFWPRMRIRPRPVRQIQTRHSAWRDPKGLLNRRETIIVPPYFRGRVFRAGRFQRNAELKKYLIIAVMGLVFFPLNASAQDRGRDAALGAVSGAVVFGPVGAVAGAVIGFTAGPSISRSLGLKEAKPRRQAQKAERRKPAIARAEISPRESARISKPVQARITQNVPIPTAARPDSTKDTLPATLPPPQASAGIGTAPPVQGFE